jgi:hypothetical protein
MVEALKKRLGGRVTRPLLRLHRMLISDNYFCRLATITFAGGSAVRTACATVRS